MKRTIVIVDDEPITRMDTREILEANGYDVVGEASDGFKAIEVCKKYNPSLVLMDIDMPLLDGIKASKVLTKEKLVGGVILLTAFEDKKYIEMAKEVERVYNALLAWEQEIQVGYAKKVYLKK